MISSNPELNCLLKDLSITNKTESSDAHVPIVLVDSESDLVSAVKRLSGHSRIAFDSEGVDLSRSGELTIATLQGICDDGGETPIYVVDVYKLGNSRVFSKALPSIRSMLENPAVTKVMFDCRNDSDALFHQFGVSLSGVLDLQVYDQAVRIHLGEKPPKRNTYLTHSSLPMLSNMDKVSQRYSCSQKIAKVAAPHKNNPNVWKQRPLGNSSIKYAANDVHMIKVLWNEMEQVNIPGFLMQKVMDHSKRYEGSFRDRPDEVKYHKDKEFVMEERAIISDNELPINHPRQTRKDPSYSEQKWDKAISSLKSKNNLNTAFNDVIFVLQHNDWYTEEGRREIRRLAAAYPFTFNQRQKIENPPFLMREDDNGDY